MKGIQRSADNVRPGPFSLQGYRLLVFGRTRFVLAGLLELDRGDEPG